MRPNHSCHNTRLAGGLTVPCCADGVDHDFSDHECVFWRKVEGPLKARGVNGTNGPMEKVCRAANHA